jgi:chemotaxis protein histidine kinase CheA
LIDPSTRLDAGLRAIFAEEADRRLTSLAAGMWQLERGQRDDDLIDSLHVDARALKGAAAVLWFDEVARVAHALGEVLSAIEDAGDPPEPGMIRTVQEALDNLRVMVADVLAGCDVTRRAAICEATLLRVAGSPASAWRPASSEPAPEAATPVERAPKSAEPAPTPASRPSEGLLEFRTPAGHFAVRLDAALAVRAASSIVRRDDDPVDVLGAIEHEGVLVPVLSALGGGSRQVLILAADGKVFGLLVDRVLGVVAVPSSEQRALLVDPTILGQAARDRDRRRPGRYR